MNAVDLILWFGIPLGFALGFAAGASRGLSLGQERGKILERTQVAAWMFGAHRKEESSRIHELARHVELGAHWKRFLSGKPDGAEKPGEEMARRAQDFFRGKTS